MTSLDGTTETTTTIAGTYTDPTTGVVYDLVPETATDDNLSMTTYVDPTTGITYEVDTSLVADTKVASIDDSTA